MDSGSIRLRLHTLLVSTFPTRTVYYRPAGDIKLQYPCIVYERKSFVPSSANSATYFVGERFQVMLINLLHQSSDARDIYILHGSNGILIESSDEYESDDLVHTVFMVSVT